MDISVYKSGHAYRRYQQDKHFDECCIKAGQALRNNPQGLSLQQVQMAAGLSIGTTKLVLPYVAVELKGKYYPKLKQ